MNTPLNTPNGTTFNCIIFFVPTNDYDHPHEEGLQRLEERKLLGKIGQKYIN